MDNDWFQAEEWKTLSYADANNTQDFYKALKTICGPKHSRCPVRSADSNAL